MELVQTAIRWQDNELVEVFRSEGGAFDVVVSKTRSHIARIFSLRALNRYLAHGLKHKCGRDCVSAE